MTTRPVNDEELVKEMAAQSNFYGGRERLAEKLEIEPRHLRSVLSGCRAVPHKAAQKLGYELRWVKKHGASS